MNLDPKWLDILKLDGYRYAALTSACAAYFVLPVEVLAPILNASWIRAVIFVVLLLSGMLTFACVLKWLFERVRPGRIIDDWIRCRSEARDAKNYIPYMTEKEKEIIGYLLFKNQKVFSTEADGGYAQALINRNIVTAVRPPNNIAYGTYDFQFEIPDHIWTVLVERRDLFPRRGSSESGEPWHISSRLR